MNFPPITVNNLFKFLSRMVIWHFFLIHFKLSDKKLPLLTSKSLIIQVNNSWLASRGLKVTTEGVFFTRILRHPYQNHGVFKFQILGCTSFSPEFCSILTKIQGVFKFQKLERISFFTRILRHLHQNFGVFKFQILECISFFTRNLQYP